MARSTKEWIGKTDDTPIPPRVKLRVKSRANDCCQDCGVRVRYGGQIDHIMPLIQSTECNPLNRESNLRFLCRNCHSKKTSIDIKRKASEAKTKAFLAGFKPKSKLSRPRVSKLKIRGHWMPNDWGGLTWVPPDYGEDN